MASLFKVEREPSGRQSWIVHARPLLIIILHLPPRSAITDSSHTPIFHFISQVGQIYTQNLNFLGVSYFSCKCKPFDSLSSTSQQYCFPQRCNVFYHLTPIKIPQEDNIPPATPTYETAKDYQSFKKTIFIDNNGKDGEDRQEIIKLDGLGGSHKILERFPDEILMRVIVRVICDGLLIDVIIQSKPNMSITAIKENLAQETSFFYSNVLPHAHYVRQRPLHKFGSFQLPIQAQEKDGKSSQKQEKQRLHNSHGKITRGTLQMLKNEAMAFRKKIALKSSSDLSAFLLSKRNKNNNKQPSPQTQQKESLLQMPPPPITFANKKVLSSASSSTTFSSLENSKHDSETTCGDSSIQQRRQYKTLQLGARSEVFQILRFLDSGSFGEVHLVRHLGTGMLLCLKSMCKSQFCPESLGQLAREIRIQSSLNHPNIIKVYGCTSDQKNVYILMQPCLGKNLFKLMSGGSVKETEARGYLLQVCQAVGYLHSLNIIHRDIKPQNVLIDSSGTAKLCDFGWAVYAPLMRGTCCGTPLYTPPEMIRKESYDSRVDVWCIGLMAYQLLYGALPFQIHTLDDLPRIATDPVTYPPSHNVSEEAEDFMRGCLAKESEGRLTIRMALQHSFLQKRKLQFRHTFP